ncbi:MAG: hypothetical protein ACLFNZ_11655 [Spirochaetaceae bacterium]
MKEYDVCVIRTGTAGETAVAELLSRNPESRISITDERPYGGTCALRGCQPKKFLLVPSHAGELINLFALAIKKKITAEELKELPWAYSTYSVDFRVLMVCAEYKSGNREEVQHTPY